MPDILARYGPFFLYAYTAILGLGLVASVGLTALLARRRDVGGWFDGALAASAGTLLAGRAVFVWLNQPYFAENPAEALQLWLGGLNYHGALLGGLAGLWLWARLTHRSFYDYAGLFAPGLALLVAAGWAACGVEGCAYGRAAAPGLLAANLPDDLGVLAVRYRTQLGGAVVSLAVFGVALWAFGRARPGLLFWGTLGALSLGRAVIALGRGDVAPLIAGRRLDLIIDLGLFVVSLLGAIFIVAARRSPDKINDLG
jgi:phosphatidylglycerol:prolipoprotein diacylglycerol transferase